MRPSRPAAERLFRDPWFAVPWSLFLFVSVIALWPIRDAALVWWVFGQQGYRDGIRLATKFRFTNGALVPTFPDIVTGFGYFLLVTIGLTLLAMAVLRGIDRRLSRRASG